MGAYYLGWTINCLNIVRVFVQYHDMAHFSFFESIWLNKLFGHLIALYVHFPFQMWRDGHNYHHKHFGNLDKVDLSQTILFTKKQYESYPTLKKLWIRLYREPLIFFFISAEYIWTFGVLYIAIKKYGLFSSACLEKLAAMGSFYVFWLLDLPILEMYVCLHMAELLGNVLFHLQHSVNMPYRERMGKWDFNRAALEGSTFLEIPYPLKIFTCGIEYHHIHHLNTNVASYAIQACHDKLDTPKGLNWESFNINRVDMLLAFKSLANVMLDEEKDLLIPFSYSHL